jgi:hypothetical protein
VLRSGPLKRRVAAATAAIALFVLAWRPTGEQIPLITVEGQTCCWLSYSVVDVVADPTDGKVGVLALRWQTGYTAWRVGSEVEVRDPIGAVVLRTPGRFRIIPTFPDWVVGEIEPCSTCELGGGPS